MTLSLPLLAFVVLVATAAILFYQSLHTREIALVAARHHCRAMGVQLLDQTIYCQRTRLQPGGALLAFRRWYCFEFTSTGDERYQGIVEMHGNTAQSVQLAPHRFPASSDAGQPGNQRDKPH